MMLAAGRHHTHLSHLIGILGLHLHPLGGAAIGHVSSVSLLDDQSFSSGMSAQAGVTAHFCSKISSKKLRMSFPVLPLRSSTNSRRPLKASKLVNNLGDRSSFFLSSRRRSVRHLPLR